MSTDPTEEGTLPINTLRESTMVDAYFETIHRQPLESLHVSLSPVTDREVVTVVVPTHTRADVVGKTIESMVRQRKVTVGGRLPDGSQAVPAKYDAAFSGAAT
jgi:hypothetical protein